MAARIVKLFTNADEVVIRSDARQDVNILSPIPAPIPIGDSLLEATNEEERRWVGIGEHRRLQR